MRTLVRIAVAALLLVAANAPALAAAGFRNVVVASRPDAAAAEARFSVDTPEIFVRAELVDVPPGSVVTVTWLAVDTGPANPPNFRIDQISLRVRQTTGQSLATSLPRAGDAWPAGRYRVRLSINGQTLARVDFTIG